jgi:hypothetical protein
MAQRTTAAVRLHGKTGATRCDAGGRFRCAIGIDAALWSTRDAKEIRVRDLHERLESLSKYRRVVFVALRRFAKVEFR